MSQVPPDRSTGETATGSAARALQVPGLSVRFATLIDSDLAYAFRRAPMVVAAALLLALMLLLALFAPLVAPQNPFDPAALDLMDGKTPPLVANAYTGHRYLLGTDDQGRDVLSVILHGSRISLLVGFAAVLLAAVLGVALGILAGYRGGVVDSLVMRLADVQLTFPAILVALMIFGVAKGFLPPQVHAEAALPVLVLSLGLSGWPQYARAVRGLTMVERGKDYIAAARIIGLSPARIMVRHILPNVLGPVLVLSTLGLAHAIVGEATLSFLGVGMPPTMPSLGTLIRVGQEYIASGEWWILLFPAATLLLLSLSVNVLGDWLRDTLDPRLGQR